MSRLVIGLGALFVLMGLSIAVAPEWLASSVDWASSSGQYAAAGVRAAMGLLLIVSASSTRYPKGLRLFGAVVLAAGIGIAFIPSESWAALMRWGFVEHAALYRVGGALGGVLLGAFLVWVAAAPRSAA
jgi:hypothetical protein